MRGVSPKIGAGQETGLMSRPSYAISTLVGVALMVAGCGSDTSKVEKPAAVPPPKITMLYVTPGVFENGQSSQLCYSVEDTTKVTLEPPVDRVWPALTRCIEIKPVKTTTYTLTAENATGAKVTATAEAKVVAATVKLPGVKIIDASAPPGSIQAGQGFQFCIHARNAKDWKLSAGEWFKAPEPTGGCVIDHPRKTTVYVITAIGAAGDTDAIRVTATVQ
jgi:hypothetical protein